MTRIFSMIFKVFGIIAFAYGVLTLLFMPPNIDAYTFLFNLVLDFSFGLLLFFLGRATQRLEEMEDRMGKFILLPKEHQTAYKKCDTCGRTYEASDRECPYCTIKRLKNFNNTRN